MASPAPLFIGDEVTAAAYRIAGLAVDVATPAQARARFEAARHRQVPLILITAECAQSIPAAELDAALAAFAPVVLVVPDAAGRVPPPDLAARVRGALGIAA